MSEWLLRFLLPLGAAAFADLFQHEDEDKDNSTPRPEPEPQTDGTAGDDTLSAPDGYHGRVMGRDGDDLITVGSHKNASHYHDGTTLTPDGGQWNGWPDWDPNSPGAVPPGVVLARGGEGADTIVSSGRSIHAQGDAGDDRIELHSEPGDLSEGRGDVVTGRGDTADGLRFRLHDGADFTRNDSDESFVAREGSRVDGGGGNDLLTNSYLDRSSVTLIGGAGDDSLVGNDAVGAHASRAQDGYSWRVGASSDSLDGGNGDDLIGYDRDDTITGGSGPDRMDGFVDSREHATVTDFNPAQD